MKRISYALLLGMVWAMTASVWAQSAATRTRPRRVGGTANTTPTPTPAPTATPDQETAPAGRDVTDETAPADDDNDSRTNRRPPTLGGPSNGPRPTGTPNAPTPDGPLEVDEDDIVRVATTLVTVPVSVLDRNGKYIPNLRQSDFQLFEDNKPQEIAYFSSVEAPFTVALVIDTSGSTETRIREIQEAANTFVNQLRPDDRVMVVSFDDRISVLCEPTNDRYTLRNAIYRISVGQGTKLYDALDYVMNVRLSRIQGRKAIVLFTDGVDTTSKRASYNSTTQDAEELDALIYPVQYDTYAAQQRAGNGGGWPGPSGSGGGGSVWGQILGGILTGGTRRGGGGGGGGGVTVGNSRADYDRADAYLQELADKTGARKYRAESLTNANQAFALVAEELRRQYSIGYYPNNSGAANNRRRIRVRVNRSDLVVRARDSYIYSGGDPQNASAPNAPTGPPQIRKTPFSQTN